jgi:hypothetical protein
MQGRYSSPGQISYSFGKSKSNTSETVNSKGWTRTSTEAAGAWRRRAFSGTAVSAYWLINVISLVVLLGWIFTDGRFADIALRAKQDLLSLIRWLPSTDQQEPRLASRLIALEVLGVLVVTSAIGIATALFYGGPKHRRVRSWLSLTALVAAWLTLWATWPELLWQGQVYRLKRQCPHVQVTAQALANNWPASDGARAEIGPFLAYPQGQPETLLLLTQAKVPHTSILLSSVERSDQGALRFQLAGNELGAWLEWHPSQDEPRGFIGGLQQRFELEQFSPLGNNLFLVRYK